MSNKSRTNRAIIAQSANVEPQLTVVPATNAVAETADPKILEQGPTDEIPETKEEAFRRLANKRVEIALDKIRIVGNLSNRAIYSYTPKQVEFICNTLRMQIQRIENQFTKTKAEKTAFSMDDVEEENSDE